MIEEILFVHHSHTDIGYTHPQPVVMELQRRFIDQALDLSEHTADWPEECRFRWTCEVTGITLDWWRHAENIQRERFLKAVERRQFEVAGLRWNMTPLMDHHMILEVLAPIKFFRSLGIPIRSAMNSDVNGLPWGVVDALLDHGVEGLSMAINEYFGHALRPWPQGFYWESPSGRKLLSYNGFIYGITVDRHIKVPIDEAEAQRAIPAYLEMWEGRGYPYPFLMMQATNTPMHDNGAPNLQLCTFIRRWNDAGHPIRLRIATLSEFFEQLRQQPPETLPTLRGDWSDWWNFGSGSTAADTSIGLAAQRALREAQQLEAWPLPTITARQEQLFEAAGRATTLYAEHTWGAERSIRLPHSLETHLQKTLKLALASEGYSLARMLRRDGLERLARHAGGDQPHGLFWNPLPYPVERILQLPKPSEEGADDAWLGQDLETAMKADANTLQRQDALFSDLSEDLTRWVGPVKIPALGYLAKPLRSFQTARGELHADNAEIGNERLRLRFDEARGGVTSLQLDGHEYVGKSGEGWSFALPVLEHPASNQRDEIFGPIDFDSPDWFEGWHPDWQAVRQGPTELLEAGHRQREGCIEYRQVMRLSSGDTVTNSYRVFPRETGIELISEIHKQALEDPHALYLAFPLEPGNDATCHFETAGAVVELEREQLPYSNQHFVTTQRWISLQGDQRGLSVACPDAPLWQVGGFTFGRHENGRVPRPESSLIAWLTNNYWVTNFQADQAGLLRFRFHLVPHPHQELAESIRTVLPFTVPPQLHIYRNRGPKKNSGGQLLDLDLAGAVLTGLEQDDQATLLYLLNPKDEPLIIRIAPGILTPRSVWRLNLSGTPGEALSCQDGCLKLVLPPRSWTGLKVEC